MLIFLFLLGGSGGGAVHGVKFINTRFIYKHDQNEIKLQLWYLTFKIEADLVFLGSAWLYQLWLIIEFT